jgi:hypothetical protein
MLGRPSTSLEKPPFSGFPPVLGELSIGLMKVIMLHMWIAHFQPVDELLVGHVHRRRNISYLRDPIMDLDAPASLLYQHSLKSYILFIGVSAVFTRDESEFRMSDLEIRKKKNVSIRFHIS